MVEQLRGRWDSWLDLLEANGFVVRALLQAPAADWELAALEAATGLRLPGEILAFYRLANGQRRRPTLGEVREGRAEPWPDSGAPLFGFYEFLNTRDATVSWAGWRSLSDQEGPAGMADFDYHVEVADPTRVKKAYWRPGWLPFARDGGGNDLAFDFEPESAGTVGQVIVIGPDEDRRRVLGPSIGGFLERLVAEWHVGRVSIATGHGGNRYYDPAFMRAVSP